MTLTGYVVANAEKKLSKNGKEYITFRIGNNEYADNDEQGNKKTYWVNVTSFNDRFFSMVQYLTKGKPVIITGDYSDRIYQNREGNCEIARDLRANSIYFNSVGERDNTQQNTGQTPQAAPQTQVKMEAPKPTTAELKIPTAPAVNDDEDDDLPF